MKLPNAEQAVVDITKLCGYVLSQTHPRGRHKARVFLAALDLTAQNADELWSALLQSVRTSDAVTSISDDFGIRYTVDFDMVRATKARTSAWPADYS